MEDRMWNVFLQTGNVEAYLMMKQWENEKENEEIKEEERIEMKMD